MTVPGRATAGTDADDPSADTLADDSATWRTSHFKRFVLARAISVSGSTATFLAMPILVYERTASPFLTSLTAAVGGFVYLATGLPVGAIADRVDRRRMMIGAELVRAGLLVTIPIASSVATLSAAHCLLVVGGAAVCFVAFDAASLGWMTGVVGRHHLGRATATVSGVLAGVETVGPVAAGALIAATSPETAIAYDAVTFLVAACLISTVQGDNAPRRKVGRGRLVRDGTRRVLESPRLRSLVFVAFALSLAEGAYFGQFVVLARERLHFDATDPRLGWLVAAMGVGTIAGSALVGRLIDRVGADLLLLRSIPVATVAGVLAPLPTSWEIVVGVVLVWSGAYMVAFVTAIVERQRVAGDDLQGRVAAIGRMASFGAGVPAGAVLAGAIATVTSPVVGVVLVAGIGGVVVTPAWRGLRTHLSSSVSVS